MTKYDIQTAIKFMMSNEGEKIISSTINSFFLGFSICSLMFSIGVLYFLGDNWIFFLASLASFLTWGYIQGANLTNTYNNWFKSIPKVIEDE
jgi:hypothetical protein